MSDDEESLSDLYPRSLPAITHISKDLIQPSVPEVSLIATNDNFFNDRAQTPPLINKPPKSSEPKHFSSYNEWKKHFYSNRHSQINQPPANEWSSNNPKQGILKKSYTASTLSTTTPSNNIQHYTNSQLTKQKIIPESFNAQPQITENNNVMPSYTSTAPSHYTNYPYHHNPFLGMTLPPGPPPPLFLNHQFNGYPFISPYQPYPTEMHPDHSPNTKPKKYSTPPPQEDSPKPKTPEKSIQIEDIFHLISKQNEQIQNLQKQIDSLVIRQSEQDEERRREKERWERREREWQEEMDKRKEEEERWRRRLREDEKLKREQLLKEEEKQREKYDYLKTKTSQPTTPFNDSVVNSRRIQEQENFQKNYDIETIDIRNTSRSGRNKISIGVMTSFVEVSDSEHPKDVSLTLHGLDLANVPERRVSPEPPVHVQMKDYPGSDESDTETPAYREPQIGWTFYENVVGEVNKLLKNSPPPTNPVTPTVPSTTKRVTFESPSDTSLRMNALALKYLNEHQLREFAQMLSDDKKASDPMDSAGVNLSQATMRYMERYHLLPGKTNMQVNRHRLLDLKTLKQQPKLL